MYMFFNTAKPQMLRSCTHVEEEHVTHLPYVTLHIFMGHIISPLVPSPQVLGIRLRRRDQWANNMPHKICNISKCVQKLHTNVYKKVHINVYCKSTLMCTLFVHIFCTHLCG